MFSFWISFYIYLFLSGIFWLIKVFVLLGHESPHRDTEKEKMLNSIHTGTVKSLSPTIFYQHLSILIFFAPMGLDSSAVSYK